MVAVDLGYDRFGNLCRVHRIEVERAAAIDYGEDPAAQCRQPGDMRGGARDRYERIEFDNPFDG
ncbi:MAG: hypothetical protein NVS3B5_08720 [Sphingomicrobium sp.]